MSMISFVAGGWGGQIGSCIEAMPPGGVRGAEDGEGVGGGFDRGGVWRRIRGAAHVERFSTQFYQEPATRDGWIIVHTTIHSTRLAGQVF